MRKSDLDHGFKRCEKCNRWFRPARKTSRFCGKRCRHLYQKHLSPGSVENGYVILQSRGVSTGSLGAARELVVCSDLLMRGFPVFRAESPSCPCDLVAIVASKMVRVEVTTGKMGNSGKVFWAPHDPTKYDLLALVFDDSSIVYKPDIESILLQESEDALRRDGHGLYDRTHVPAGKAS